MSSPAQRLEVDRLKFPAMNVAEVLVWKEWLRLHEHEFDPLPSWWLQLRATQPGGQPAPGDKFDYNIRLGQGRDPGPSFDQNIRQAAILGSQFRVDAVGFQGDTPTLIEVKRNAGPAELGQIVSYDAIWRAQKLTPTDPKMRLVAANFKEAALHAMQEHGIQLDIVPVNFAVLSPWNTRPL